MTRSISLALALAAALGAAPPAAAQDAGKPQTAPADAAPKIHASHRVDVIAPGERVETVLDRSRGASTAPPRRAAETRALPTRALERHELRRGEDSVGAGAALREGEGGAAMGETGGEAPKVEQPETERLRSR
jgi:hypothetical protein